MLAQSTVGGKTSLYVSFEQDISSQRDRWLTARAIMALPDGTAVKWLKDGQVRHWHSQEPYRPQYEVLSLDEARERAQAILAQGEPTISSEITAPVVSLGSIHIFDWEPGNYLPERVKIYPFGGYTASSGGIPVTYFARNLVLFQHITKFGVLWTALGTIPSMSYWSIHISLPNSEMIQPNTLRFLAYFEAAYDYERQGYVWKPKDRLVDQSDILPRLLTWLGEV